MTDTDALVDHPEIALVDDSMQLCPDRTVVLRLLPRGGKARYLRLREPSMREIPRLRRVFLDADNELPGLPTLNPDRTARTQDEVQAWADALQARADIIWGEDSPHAAAIMVAVQMLGDDPTVTDDDIPSGAINPATMRKALGHWQAPLGGLESVVPTPSLIGPDSRATTNSHS